MNIIDTKKEKIHGRYAIKLKNTYKYFDKKEEAEEFLYLLNSRDRDIGREITLPIKLDVDLYADLFHGEITEEEAVEGVKNKGWIFDLESYDVLRKIDDSELELVKKRLMEELKIQGSSIYLDSSIWKISFSKIKE